ncbi:putative HTH-type transcriptional repressor ExuR [compost metagenome]
MSRLMASGVNVPADIAVVGFDDIPFAESETMSLTTVRQPSEHMARQAIDQLIARMQWPDAPATHVLVSPSLVVRRTSGRPRSRAPS